jgi:prolyl-tRNA synthetase
MEDFDKNYENIKKVYTNIFNRLWIWKDTVIAMASGWAMSEKPSHEFQTFLEIWEDTIYVCKKCGLAYNSELVWENFACSCQNKDFEIKKASEVWNIFHLWTKYTKPFWITFTDQSNKQNQVEMWCYGIWISRLMWVLAEYFLTEKWISWPENVAPYDYDIIVIWEENIEKAEKLLYELEEIEWKSVIIDDRFDLWFGQRASDCELWWIPNRIVISPKTLEKWWYELQTKTWEVKIIQNIDFL